MVWAGAGDLAVYIIRFHQPLPSTDLYSLTALGFDFSWKRLFAGALGDFGKDIQSPTIAQRNNNGSAANSLPTSSYKCLST